MKIVIKEEPMSQLRPRINGNRMYDVPKVSSYKKMVSWEAKSQYKGKLLTDPLVVEMKFYRSIQKKGSIKTKQDKRDGIIRPTSVPDVSNYVKLIEDALNGVVYKDDSQIVRLVAEKYYSDNPRTEVSIRLVTEGE